MINKISFNINKVSLLVALIFFPTLCVGEYDSYFEKTAAGQLFIEKQEEYYIKKLLDSSLLIQDMHDNKQDYLEKENKLKQSLNLKRQALNEELSKTIYDRQKLTTLDWKYII